VITALEIGGTFLVVVGTGFLLLAAVGVVRLPDVFARQHAGGKAATLGVMTVLLGVAALVHDTPATVKLLLAIAFQLVAAPTATHALARVAYRDGVPMWDRTAIDELAEAYTSGDPSRTPEDDQGVRPRPRRG
jgi:multicomponent Na+:H+ antiporter subunit G